MSKIRIKNFGPIKEGMLDNDGWMDIKKVTVFIGNQGSGKSTVAKLISTLTWLEKSYNRGDFSLKETTPHNFLKHFEFQGIQDYFLPNTEFEYIGSKYHFFFKKKGYKLEINEIPNKKYIVPKIMYVPSERNFLSTIENSFKVTNLPEHLFSFAQELRMAQRELFRGKVDLPIYKYIYEFDKESEKSYIKIEGHSINLLYASSGFQSLIPLFLVTRYLTNLIRNTNKSYKDIMSVNQSLRLHEEITQVSLDYSITMNERQKLIDVIKSKFINKCVINIIEEPEQNLFPSSQRLILNNLINYNNRIKSNKLIITTHSPYIINYLTLAVKAYHVTEKYYYEKVSDSKSNKSKINEIVPLTSLVNPADLIIYELKEENGTITKLPEYKGLPSDENFLNSSLEDTNELFAQLQEIEKGWR